MSSNPNPPANVSSNTVSLEPNKSDSQLSAVSTEVSALTTSKHYDEPSLNISVLPTALVQIQDCVGRWQGCRVLLEVSFITEECVQRLGLSRREAKIDIHGLEHQSVGQTRGITQFTLRPYFPSNFKANINAYVTHSITSTRSPSALDASTLKIINGERMADPSPPTVTRIDILIGIDHFWSLLSEGQLRVANKIVAQNSKLGWIMAGTCRPDQDTAVMTLSCDINMEKALAKFWESEELENVEKLPEHNSCEEHFIQNYSRQETGRFMVKLPFKDERQLLGNSYEIAKSRLFSMERKFRVNPQFHQLYLTFMKEYQELNHMTPVSRPENEEAIYLPHHGVLKESSTTTKLRVVFDASAVTSTGISLNNTLEVGPTIQNSLYHVLVHFRKNRIAFTADIEKMYHQILVHPVDRKYQHILWRNNVEDPIQVYELNTVTYGMTPSSFLATRVLQAVADEQQDRYPEAAKVIREDMYMDDLMSGANSVADAVRLSREIDTILKGAGMNLRKWGSNSQQFLHMVRTTEVDAQLPISLTYSDITQVLGLQWIPDADVFTYRIQLDAKPTFTKRKMLSEFSRIFDPLGLLAPFIIKIKVMFQQLWLLKLTWDEPLPPKEQREWLDLRNQISDIKTVKISRWLGVTNEKTTIHGFSDASEKAYAAVVYLCTEEDGIARARLITAKTKVAPTNTVSVARLELCGALLLTRLMEQIGIILEIPTERMVA